jgi:hypothetical protein
MVVRSSSVNGAVAAACMGIRISVRIERQYRVQQFP